MPRTSLSMINATSLPLLLEELREMPCNVPPRGFGRRTEHTEPWVMKRLVASLASAGLLQFPLSIELRDRPDIVVVSNGLSIGIELMELIPPAYAEADAIANKEFPSAIVDRSVFGWGTDWTPAAIRDYLKRNGHRLTGKGWAGDSVEREWAAAVCSAIQKKSERLNGPGFRHFAVNWLGTYASSPGPIFNAEVGAQLLSASDLHHTGYSQNFDLVANLVSDYLVVLSGKGAVTHPRVTF